MPRRRIDVPAIDALSILDADGRVDQALDPAIGGEQLRRLYRTCLLARQFDERMIRLQRQGRIGTFLSTRGHEAAVLGSVSVLRPSDWLVPVFREWPAYVWRGWPLEQLILSYAGFAEAMHVPEGVLDLPVTIPVGSHVPHAVGVAYAARYRGDDSVTLCYFGDGASSHGDCQEALNFAGVFQVPAVFVCVNNQWAISVPRARQTHASSIAQKAVAYGFPGHQVDGNDILAVYAATREAVDRARRGEGPTLIEALTYRLGAHSTADDPTKYRSDAEVAAWEAREPLRRFRRYLETRKLMDDALHARWETEVEAEVRSAVERAEARMRSDTSAIFDHVYETLPAELVAQRQEHVGLLEADPPPPESGGRGAP